MPNHDLRRNPENEPVCVCGYRPAVLDGGFRPWVGRVKAQTAVLDHAKALNEYEATVDELAKPAPMDAAVTFAEDVLQFKLTPWQKEVLRRSPDAPFTLRHARYPRAGVRQTQDGRWKLMGWDRDDVAHVIVDEPYFDDREEAFEVGRIIIGAHRQSGTDLNGLGQ
ncbi:hypothetical protein [Pseudarthrobacter cellobiosi]|uniref:hypothetical protein n=1 Tax=Pseudarthrobacter cellobiosi TaxID=2953654 RepID=UPI00208E5AAF|nr:hypothetical protein [Pseudarthrobacter sp. HLT1-5]MCO4256491.1 hypothetical protein [Pseudarthrobacter sp. HLT1-5]